jgi:polysaccharide export outer membrane protein
MRRHYDYKQLTSLIFLIIFLAGCASTGSNVGEGEKESAALLREDLVKPESIKISEFVLGVGDIIEITVYRHDDLKRSIKINPTGKIMFPLIGDVQAAGMGIFKLRDELKERLSKYIVDPQVTINITSVQSQKIMVLGEVNSPGIFTLDSSLTIMEAISKAGGMTSDAKLSNVILIRREQGKPQVASLDLKKVFKEGDFSQNIALQSGDIVYLPAVFIADVSWFFGHLSSILSPIMSLESGIVLWPQVKDALKGKGTTTPLSIPAQ